jgi:hypothetical protein
LAGVYARCLSYRSPPGKSIFPNLVKISGLWNALGLLCL